MIVSYCTIKLRFNFSDILWRYFCFQLRLILKFFFLSNGITSCLGVLIPILHSGGTAKSNFAWFICCLVKKILFWFSIFFPKVTCPPFWKFSIQIFSDIFLGEFVTVLFRFTRTCSFSVVPPVPHFLRCQGFFEIFVKLLLLTFFLEIFFLNFFPFF